MTVNLQMVEKPDYLLVRLTGPGSPEEAGARFADIVGRCQQAGLRRALLDFSGLAAGAAALDTFPIADKAVVFARAAIKVAYHVTPEQIESRQFGPLDADGRGLNLQGFDDVGAAEEWLMEGLT